MTNTGGSVTMRDVANSLNVSVTTVSKVVNGQDDISEATRRAVLDKIAELGYVPNIMATSLRRVKTKMVAIVLSDLSKPYFGCVLEGCEETLSCAGFQTMSFNSMEDAGRENLFIRQISSMNMAGIIIDPAQKSDPEQHALKLSGIPYVFSNRFLNADTDYYVAADNEAAGYMATSHLLGRYPGRPVICVSGPSRISPTVMRLSGYDRACREGGIVPSNECIFEDCYGLADAYKIGEAIAERFSMPVSVFCHTDEFAVGLLRALRDRDLRVPEDVAVISVDDIDIARYLTPSLTTVSIPKRRIGEESAKMLLSLIEGRAVDKPGILLKPELIIRETS